MITLCEQWLEAKAAEAAAIATRRKVEDDLCAALNHRPNAEGTVNHEAGPYRVKIVTRFNQKVDSDLLQEIAAEHGLDEHLPNLFRWKPEIIAAKWKAAHHNITDKLARAVTTTPGRPSFSIEQKDA
jgi:hypothetical protein